ncbi:hypothetical protein ACIOC2_13960 [Streptomyces sp. NPDC088337]|uniref:hypothetical protein n=1 Tax=unclassified Streptomyces TaxID=2593676 RepID=UPI00380382B9
MDDHMYVHVPSDLWELLEDADFDEIEIGTRSAGQWSSVAQAVLSVGNEGLAVSANLVGVYLAREQIAEFARRAAAWFGFRIPGAGTQSGSVGPGTPPLVLTITTGPPGNEVRIEIRSTPGSDGTPALDTAALTHALVSAIDMPPQTVRTRTTDSPSAN